MNTTTAAVDLAKNVYQVAIATSGSASIEQHRLTRIQFERFFANRHVDADGRWRLQEVGGRLYASGTTANAGDDTIDFAEPQVSNPFLRMLVFASFLLLRPPRQ